MHVPIRVRLVDFVCRAVRASAFLSSSKFCFITMLLASSEILRGIWNRNKTIFCYVLNYYAASYILYVYKPVKGHLIFSNNKAEIPPPLREKETKKKKKKTRI